MSYDLMVFEASAAPRKRKEFLEWHTQQTKWDESHGYNNPEVPTPTLRAWFKEMIKTYPPMNGPLASNDFDDPRVTDYSVGRLVIYGAFAWSQAEEAYRQVSELAAKHRVGFFDVSSEESNIWFPSEGDGLIKIEE